MSDNNNTTTSPTPLSCAAPSDHFNSLLDQARTAITCDSDCQYRKTSKELQDKYLAAKSNISSGPQQLDDAQKNYLIFTQGQSGYSEYQDKTLEVKAEKVSEIFEKKFKEEIKNVTSNIHTYNSLLTNYKNVLDLYTKYKEENIILEKTLKNDSSDILTNERKTFYEDQGIDNLNYYYYVMVIIYIITIIVFGISIFVFPSDMNLAVKCGILVGLVIIPFISSYILALIISISHKIYNTLPKNVHLTV